MSFTSTVQERCSFTIHLNDRYGAQPADFAATRLESALRPLLNAATDVFVYAGLKADAPLLNSERFLAIASKSRGRFRLTLGSELIAGHEELWLATGWGRGSVVILVPAKTFLDNPLLAGWGSLGITWNYRVAHNAGAISFARKQVEQQGCVAVCLPASNGIEWADLFAPAATVTQLWQEACKLLPILT